MIKVLEQACLELGDLFGNGWRSLDIDYHPPRVERLWRPFRDHYRLFLHVIHPCEPGEALLHPHPWPSAVQLVSGAYAMEVGHGKTRPTSLTASLVLRAGSFYEMTDPLGWHSVRPLERPSLSIMVTGQPFPRPRPRAPVKPEAKLKELSFERKEEILDEFRGWWTQRSSWSPLKD